MSCGSIHGRFSHSSALMHTERTRFRPVCAPSDRAAAHLLLIQPLVVESRADVMSSLRCEAFDLARTFFDRPKIVSRLRRASVEATRASPFDTKTVEDAPGGHMRPSRDPYVQARVVGGLWRGQGEPCMLILRYIGISHHYTSIILVPILVQQLVLLLQQVVVSMLWIGCVH